MEQTNLGIYFIRYFFFLYKYSISSCKYFSEGYYMLYVEFLYLPWLQGVIWIKMSSLIAIKNRNQETSQTVSPVLIVNNLLQIVIINVIMKLFLQLH